MYSKLCGGKEIQPEFGSSKLNDIQIIEKEILKYVKLNVNSVEFEQKLNSKLEEKKISPNIDKKIEKPTKNCKKKRKCC